ncbi:MAG: helix-turn-helix domain-containing protein [Gammaproteobacteria bacterium]
MASYNPRLAKAIRTYTVDEVARLYRVHKNTVRNWIKQGLKTTDGTRPFLILGSELRAFLQLQRKARKRPCAPGELYCVRCRKPQRPAGDMVEFQAINATTGDLIGLCPTCECWMYRKVSTAKLYSICSSLDVTGSKAIERIGQSESPSVNCDFR